ncbi:hypothetical protein ACQKGC_12395 [Allorhizobium pseudoryzae]|uniref:hypothetical protein n=1 Tax=Allorhizobium pseudoryzae TaxID=379684 RepID=UPI003D043940
MLRYKRNCGVAFTLSFLADHPSAKVAHSQLCAQDLTNIGQIKEVVDARDKPEHDEMERKPLLGAEDAQILHVRILRLMSMVMTGA